MSKDPKDNVLCRSNLTFQYGSTSNSLRDCSISRKKSEADITKENTNLSTFLITGFKNVSASYPAISRAASFKSIPKHRSHNKSVIQLFRSMALND